MNDFDFIFIVGVRAHSLNGYERLAILHRMFHPADNQKFKFAWDAIWKTGLSSKDFIAPDSFTFKSGQVMTCCVQIGYSKKLTKAQPRKITREMTCLTERRKLTWDHSMAGKR